MASEYHQLKMRCLYGRDPYDILQLTRQADENMIHDSFRRDITLWINYNREGRQESQTEEFRDDVQEMDMILEQLLFAYNLLIDPIRRQRYDLQRETEQIYTDKRSLHYHNQITVEEMKSWMENYPEASRKIDITFIAIVASFLIVFETLLLIFTSGDSRLTVYIINAACLFAVATVELQRWKRHGSEDHYLQDTYWNTFFYDPLGVRTEILKKSFEEWNKEDFEYIALFNRGTLEEYQKDGLHADEKVYDIFKDVIEENYQKIAIDKWKDQMDDKVIDRGYRIYKKWHDIMNDDTMRIHLWQLIPENEMDYVLRSLAAEDRDMVRKAMYRLYYYWNYIASSQHINQNNE